MPQSGCVVNYAIYPKPILGPCSCQDCGELLYWARRNTSVGGVTVGSLRWRDWTGHIHKCAAKAEYRRIKVVGRRGWSLLRQEAAHPHV